MYNYLELCNVKNEQGLCSATRSKKLWRGKYCCVPLCRNSSGQNAEREKLGLPNLSFHCFPSLDTEIGKMWILKIRRDPGPNFHVNEHTRICSQHFTSDDFVTLLDCSSIRPRLKPTAIPSIFPWSRIHGRTTLTSKIAFSAKQRKDVNYLKSEIQCSDDEDVGVNDETVDHENPLDSCDIVDELQMLRLRISQLQVELDSAKNFVSKSLFSLENIKRRKS